MADLVDPQAVTRPQADVLWLRRLNKEGILALLPDPPEPPAEFFRGLREFNQGQYWQAYETLEGVWRETPYPLRLFYYALIKLDVGLLHLGRHNAAGARRQLVAAADFLEPFTPAFLGIPTAPLYQEARAWLQRLGRVGPTQASRGSRRRMQSEDSSFWEEFDRLPRVKIKEGSP